MTLLTVGTECFDALVGAVDGLVARGRIGTPVFAQIGAGRYIPQHLEWRRYVPDLTELVARADLVITHGGTGTVSECIRSGRRFIAVPDRLKSEDHQTEFLRALETRFDYCWATSPDELDAVLDQARPARRLDTHDATTLARDVLEFVRDAPRKEKGAVRSHPLAYWI